MNHERPINRVNFEIRHLTLLGLMNFQKIKKKLVFHIVLRWSRRCGLIQPPPLSGNIQEPRSIRVNHWNFWDVKFNPNAAGAYCALIFSEGYCSIKEGSGGLKWLFLILYKLSEDQKKLLVHSVLGNIKGVGTPCSQASKYYG